MQVSMIIKSNINSVRKLEQNLYKFQNSGTIIESKYLSLDSSVTSINCENFFLTKAYFLSTYLRIAGSYLVSENLTSVVAASVFVDYN